MIVQQFHPLPKFGDSYMLIGSWLVNDQPAGIGIREDRALITQDMSRFYPPKFGDSYMLIGSWLVNDQPAGIGIREDRALITQDMSRFYPHIFVE